jgi:hypothetical protein
LDNLDWWGTLKSTQEIYIMLKVVFGFLFIAVVSLVVALIKKKSGKAPVDFPYQSKEVLF